MSSAFWLAHRSETINKATASRKLLQVYGFINLNEPYVKLFTSDRNCRFAECGEVHFIQRADEKERAGGKLSVLHY